MCRGRVEARFSVDAGDDAGGRRVAPPLRAEEGITLAGRSRVASARSGVRRAALPL